MVLMISLSFTVTMMTMISRQQHILPSLVCLESLMLFLITFITMSMNNKLMEATSFMLMLLTMSVASASVGLALLVTLCRKEGNDLTMLHSINQC